MIVTCERCATQFQLDDARIPQGGVRVRCSRCKHAFFVEVPPKNEMERIHRVARRALEEAEEGPGITHDLPESTPAEPPPETSAEPDRSDFATDDEESDWEFNDQGPSGAELDFDAPSETERGMDSAPAASGLELDDDDESPFDLAGAADEGPEEAPGPLDEAAETAAEETGPSAAAGSDSPLDAGGSDSVPSGPDPQPAAAEIGAGTTQGDELGSPDDWDIFEDVAAPEPMPAIAEEPPPRLAEPLPAVPAEVFEEEEAVARWPRWLGSAVGWGATLALCGIGLALGFTPRVPGAAAATPAEVGGLQPREVQAAWIENAIHGPLYVVSGALQNAGSSAVASGPLAVVLLDASGQDVGEPAALGAPLPARLLREGDRDAIRAEFARSGGPLLPELAPGEQVRFQVVLWELPPEAERFAFEVLEVDDTAPAPAPEIGSEPSPEPLDAEPLEAEPPDADALSSGALPPSPPPSEG